jgi:Mg-chelatase subunit ChlI
MILPRAPSEHVSHFLQAPNTIAGDEIEAHTGMFDGKTNDGYYELGLIAAQLVRDVMVASRSEDMDTKKEVAKHPSGEENVTKLGDDEGAKIANERGKDAEHQEHEEDHDKNEDDNEEEEEEDDDDDEEEEEEEEDEEDEEDEEGEGEEEEDDDEEEESEEEGKPKVAHVDTTGKTRA